jgi:hypothetical protein
MCVYNFFIYIYMFRPPFFLPYLSYLSTLPSIYIYEVKLSGVPETPRPTQRQEASPTMANPDVDGECMRYLEYLIKKEMQFMPCPAYLTTVQTRSFMTPKLRTQCGLVFWRDGKD